MSVILAVCIPIYINHTSFKKSTNSRSRIHWQLIPEPCNTSLLLPIRRKESLYGCNFIWMYFNSYLSMWAEDFDNWHKDFLGLVSTCYFQLEHNLYFPFVQHWTCHSDFHCTVYCSCTWHCWCRNSFHKAFGNIFSVMNTSQTSYKWTQILHQNVVLKHTLSTCSLQLITHVNQVPLAN